MDDLHRTKHSSLGISEVQSYEIFGIRFSIKFTQIGALPVLSLPPATMGDIQTCVTCELTSVSRRYTETVRLNSEVINTNSHVLDLD